MSHGEEETTREGVGECVEQRDGEDKARERKDRGAMAKGDGEELKDEKGGKGKQ